MSAAGLQALAHEARSAVQAARGELSSSSTGAIAVSGMLAEQLAKELGAGAAPGAVLVHDATRLPTVDVLVRVIAGEPSSEDEELVDAADRRGAPVVLVQLWPQADWKRPFVLSPFVVECRPGKGFPLEEIASRIFDASEHGPLLAANIPVLKETIASGLVQRAVLRSALLGVTSSGKATRPLLALEQVRLLARLRAASGAGRSDEIPVVAAGVGVALASGFAFRSVARAARDVLPEPVADTAVAAAGTWALAKALQLLESRLPSG